MKKFLTIIILALASLCASAKGVQHLSDYVSTLVGTASDYSLSAGNTYPALALPWGMNFWTPQTGKMGNGWQYTYSAHHIRGLKQTHQPSPWINDYGQFSIMPVRGRMLDEESRKSIFSHQSELALPYYYKVYLADHDVLAEMSPTERSCIMRFTFPESAESAIVIDAFDQGSEIRMIDNKTIAGYSSRNSGGVASNFRNYFIIKFDKDIQEYTFNGDTNHAIARVGFNTTRGELITLRVASSFISEAQAIYNLESELKDYSFDEIKSQAQERWDEVLGRIEVQGGSEDQYKTFYSCLYRATLFPRKLYEISAESGKAIHYSPYNGQICDGYLYTDTGFWDTFRALFPLLNLVYPSVNAEIQAGLANVYRESGFLPEWASPGHRNCMVGNNSASVVSDAILKGITPPEDVATLYEAMMAGRTKLHPSVQSTGRWGHEYYDKLGYVPYNVGIKENAARTLEYAYDDWCIAQVAKLLGKDEDAKMLEKAANNYKHLFDPKHNLMRGKNEDGSFQEQFSPYKWGDAFTEGNAWHYSWSVFHDIEGLAEMMGGKDNMELMLDSLFVVPPFYDDSYYGRRIHEIAEMQVANMGNYAHGNQPAQHIIYLYDYVGKPHKAQWWAREVMDKLYSAKPDGYCGDEDNGQTSAWYVFSAMGFYPVCPGSDEYAAGSPLFEKVIINQENGNKILIDAKGNSTSRRLLKSIYFNGKKTHRPFYSYSKLIKGAKIKCIMEE